jgi:hypothetical protein
MANPIRLAGAAALALAIAAAVPARANETGQLVGVVRDEAGKPLAGARVAVTSPTWVEQFVTTNAEGQYVLAQLPPGHYRLTARADGFAPSETGTLQVFVDWRIRKDLRLSPAQASAAPADAAPIARN